MKTASSLASWPATPAIQHPRLADPAGVLGRIALVALLALLLQAGRAHAGGFFESFEGYAQGSLDSNDSAGPNQGPSGGTNAWFGSNPPNLLVVTNEYGISPHSGTNMIRGRYNGLYNNNVDWFNLSYRCATGGVYYGNIVLEWWFYDPLGAGGGGDYVDYVALCNYDMVPFYTDYESPLPSYNSQRMCLGANAPRFNTGIDATMYQVRIVGATDGVNSEGWFNLTNATRSAGWHHARIVIGAYNYDITPASFYIDDMATPALSHGTVNMTGFNLLEVNADYGNTTGYFDDFAFADDATAPAIGAGPTNLTVHAGAAASFSVSDVSGSGTLAYFWQKNGAPLSNGGRISGANTDTLTISSTVEGDAGAYTCIISNIAGVATGTATLNVIVPPTIDSQTPSGGTLLVTPGGTVALSITAHASNPMNYQWNKNGSPLANGGHISGATTASLTISYFDADDVGSYSCHLSNADGATDSAAVALGLAQGPSINVQPTNQTVAAGATATFVVGAAGPNLYYQWSKGAAPLSDGARVHGATTSALSISSVIGSDAGSYSCLITNASGRTNTAAASLTVINPPVITAQPVSQVASNGSTVAFHVTATGTSPAYQWKKNGTALSNGGDLSGVTTPDLTIHVTSLTNVGMYSVTVSNLAGSQTSSNAALRVNQPAITFFDNFESYSISAPMTYARKGTPLDHNYGANSASTDPWWGASPPNICVYTNGQENVTTHSGNKMIGGAYASVSGSDNDESFVNLAYRFNGGQIYYGNFMLDWYFYDNGQPDYSDQLTLANFGSRMPLTSDSNGYQIPAGPVQNLFIGAWPNLDTTKYQAAVMGASDGTAGIISRNIAGTTKYFDTTAARSPGWHHARIAVGPADPGTHVATASFFVDDMSNAAFTHDLPPGNVGFNAIHLVSCSIWSPQTTASAGFWDDVTFQAVNDPYIIQQPVSRTNDYQTTATFTVVAAGASYQWQKNGQNITGATGAVLTLNSVSQRDEGSYTCIVTGANGSITSSPAALTVTGSPPELRAIQIGQNVIISWQGSYTLLLATNVTGPYLAVPGATSPYTNSAPLASQRFFGLGR